MRRRSLSSGIRYPVKFAMPCIGALGGTLSRTFERPILTAAKYRRRLRPANSGSILVIAGAIARKCGEKRAARCLHGVVAWLARFGDIWYVDCSARGDVYQPQMAREMIAIAADHAGVSLKETLKSELDELGFDVLDLGTNGPESVDYPDFANAVADTIRAGKANRGVLVCGSGIGVSIAANRHPGIRAALCHDAVTARLARQHNDANVLVLGARTTGLDVAKDCLRIFMDTAFEGGRHARRVAKLG